MDTMLENGDYALDARGLPIEISGSREIIQRALIRLCVKKGALYGCPSLGSELHKLSGLHGEALDRAALSYVREALAPISEMHVESVACENLGGGAALIKINAVIDSGSYTLEVKTA